MLTNTLLLYVTQEAWAKARARLIAARHATGHDEVTAPRWREKAERRREGEGHGGRKPPPRTCH